MKPSRLTFAVLALVLAYSSGATAQEQVWLRDRRYQTGIGIRSGNLELHPGVGAEFGYDSNWFLRAPGENPLSSLRLRVTPSLAVTSISAQRREAGGEAENPKIAFRANAAGSYNEFIATSAQNSDDITSQRHISGLANLTLTILPQRPWGGDVFGDFTRTVQPSENPDLNFSRMTGRFGGGLLWAPGGGMFDWRLGYEYGFVAFEQQEFKVLNTDQHQINTRARWRFLPRTAWIADASAGFLHYTNSPVGRLDSNPIRARAGLTGLVTRSFAVLVLGGWGASFYKDRTPGSNPSQYDGFIGQAEVRYFLAPNTSDDPRVASANPSSIALGYARDFFNSALSDYFSRDRFYLQAAYLAGGNLLLSAEGAAALQDYSTVYATTSTTGSRQVLSAGFKETRLEGTGFAEYRFADAFGINGTVRYSANVTDAAIGSPVATGAAAPNALKFDRVEAYVGLRWFM